MHRTQQSERTAIIIFFFICENADKICDIIILYKHEEGKSPNNHY